MATTINADTVTGGAIITGDTSGVLGLQAAGSTLVTLDGATVSIAAGLTADSASITGGISGASATLTGAVSAASASITGAVSAASASLTGAISAASASISGALTAGGISYPTSDGLQGQALVTDGAGNLSFANSGEVSKGFAYFLSGR